MTDLLRDRRATHCATRPRYYITLCVRFHLRRLISSQLWIWNSFWFDFNNPRANMLLKWWR